MKDTDYAFAAANIRTAEKDLLSRSFIEQLINSENYDDVRRALIDKGFSEFESTDDADKALSDYMEKTWDYLSEIAPDISELEFMIVKNDFHNLKAITKGIISAVDGRKFCIKPCITDIEMMYDCITSKNFDALPQMISETAKSGYELLTSTMDGQLFDMFIDSASLEATVHLARGNAFSKKIADAACAYANIKIAMRLAKTSANDVVYSYAFSECEDLDTDELAKAARRGYEQVITYLENSEYSYLAQLKSQAAIERECDDRIMKILSEAKLVGFGIEPLIAYYYARAAEWANLRIILSAKRAGFSNDAIKERMRDIYV